MIDTQDIDEAQLVVSRLYGDIRLDCAHGHTSVPWKCNRAVLGAIGVAAGWLPYGGIIGDEAPITVDQRLEVVAELDGIESRGYTMVRS